MKKRQIHRELSRAEHLRQNKQSFRMIDSALEKIRKTLRKEKSK
jgi:ribosome-associated translation inhibitor RaiA